MHCPNCGALVPTGEKFCGNCGSQMPAGDYAPGSAAGQAPRGKKRPFVAVAIIAVVVIGLLAGGGFFALKMLKPAIPGLKTAQVGDTLTFGSYEQDGDTGNGKEPIEWRVLAVENGKALVIADKLLDCQPYNTQQTDITWENSTLRAWLNGDFLNTALSGKEQGVIAMTSVVNDDNQEYSIEGGNDTQDKVFLLSTAEAGQYFASDSDRVASWTPYCKANVRKALEKQMDEYEISQADIDDYLNQEMGWWWLRSPGGGADSAADVRFVGVVRPGGGCVVSGGDAARPALWLNL